MDVKSEQRKLIKRYKGRVAESLITLLEECRLTEKELTMFKWALKTRNKRLEDARRKTEPTLWRT